MAGVALKTFEQEGRSEDLAKRARAVAEIAASHADKVDRESRFPGEAVAALKEQRLLAIQVPVEHGGEGASLSEVADVCFALGRACASTGMIYAMHQIKIACIWPYSVGSPWHGSFLKRAAKEQLLLASSTTEGQGGGNVRSSQSPIEPVGDRFTLRRNATVVSYGAEADGLVTTARRAGDAAASDQVLIVLARDSYKLEQISTWDSLGMRGTCSAGFNLDASAELAQILPVPYQTIHARSMMPVAHMTWSSVWAGVAAAATERARRFVRNVARNTGGQTPPGAAHLARANLTLRTLKANLAASIRRYESVSRTGEQLEALEFQTEMNLLKVASSELAIATVTNALQATGLSGYRNDGDYSVTRQLRDVLSSSIMINNDRILANTGPSLMLTEVPHSLFA
jgi:acyl-CoA dehydrogenase